MQTRTTTADADAYTPDTRFYLTPAGERAADAIIARDPHNEEGALIRLTPSGEHAADAIIARDPHNEEGALIRLTPSGEHAAACIANRAAARRAVTTIGGR